MLIKLVVEKTSVQVGTGLNSPRVECGIVPLLTWQVTFRILKTTEFPGGLNNYQHLKRDLYHVVTLRNCFAYFLFILLFKTQVFCNL
jgi:hypothetical protein